jgi:cell division protein FtsQ
VSPARGPARPVGGRPGTARRWRLVRDGGTAGRFAARARRRRVRSLIPVLVVLGTVVVVVVAGWLVLGTRVLDVRTVAVEGASTLDANAVREAAGVPLGSPLARIDVDEVRTRVSALGPVADVQIYRTWPHTLVVRITERRPVAVTVAGRGRYTLLDATGVPYLTTTRRPAGIPEVRIARPGPDDRATRSALAVAGALSPELRRQLVRIQAPTAEQVTVVLRGGRAVFWGDAGRSESKATVATALLARPGKRIDVSAPDVVTVK